MPTSQTNLQAYGPTTIESLPFRRGWTAVVYWGSNTQTVACVGAATAEDALRAARINVDACLNFSLAA